MTVKPRSDRVILTHHSGASATVHLLGATVTSWTTEDGQERLYLSRNASFDGLQPIRGGIPICFPTYQRGPSQAESDEDIALRPLAACANKLHGFASKLNWEYLVPKPSVSAVEQLGHDGPHGGVRAVFRLNPASTPGLFPRLAELTYTVLLTARQLRTELKVKCPDDSPQSVKFNAFLHSYLSTSLPRNRAPAGSHALLNGFPPGTKHKDKPGTESTWQEWTGEKVDVGKDMSMLFTDLARHHRLELERDGAELLRIESRGFHDFLLWNPGSRAGDPKLAIRDMEKGDGERMCCIEPACVSSYLTLQPGESWVGTQILTGLVLTSSMHA